MQSCKNYKKYFVQALYTELDAVVLENLQKHLEKCTECRKEYNQMKNTIKQLDINNIKDPGEEYWDNYWSNLENRMVEDSIQRANSAAQRKNFSTHPQIRTWTIRILSAAAMLLIGIGIGYLYFGNPEPMDQSIKGLTPVKMTAYPQEAVDYLDRSKILLLGFINFDTDNIDPTSMDFSRQQQVANSLIKQAAVLKNDLKGRENQRVLALIKELEIILLQISNYEKEFDIPAIDLIKSGVDNNAIMMKINLEEIMRASSKDNKTQNKDISKKNIKEL
ncbi:MAG: hypothetical protein JW956_13890 [Calditrichaceae bacterium]|nr:hypothetical protein [Calditrichaceae bacterium]HES59851.1 hypothetical protein [Caldithrix sp.]